MKNDRIIYSLSIEDIQEVANDQLDRYLSSEEVELVVNSIGDHINWYEIIAQFHNRES